MAMSKMQAYAKIAASEGEVKPLLMYVPAKLHRLLY